MSRNRAEDTLDKRLVQRISDLERQILQITTPQPVGGDILQVQRTVGTITGPLTLGQNQFVIIQQRVNPGAGLISVWNYAYTIYVDVLDHQHAWPVVFDGTGVLTTGQQNLFMNHWLDYEDTNDTTGQRMFKFRIENRDSVSHNYYLHGRGYVPKQTGSA